MVGGERKKKIRLEQFSIAYLNIQAVVSFNFEFFKYWKQACRQSTAIFAVIQKSL